MDKSKIAKLCNEIEDIACDISQQTMNDIISAESRMIFDKSKEIAAEITAQPMTNADRIRQMTDEELAEFLSAVKNYCIKIPCGECDFYDAESSVDDIICNPLRWLKQEVSEDATERTD